MAELGDCPEAEMVARLIDGDLTREDRDSLEEHIAGCAECYGLLTESTEVWWRLGKQSPGDDSSGDG
jgi:hypothetical protein